MLDLPRARDRMVNVHIGRRGIRDREILQAMSEVPRETFVDPGFEEFAYEDGPLPIADDIATLHRRAHDRVGERQGW